MSERTVQVGAKWLPETCNRADLTVLLNINTRSVTDLAARGLLVPAAQRGWYQTKPSLDAYHDHLRKQAAGRGGELSLSDERAKREVILREKDALELAKIKGEVLSLAEVADGWTGLVKKVKAMFLAFPSKARQTIPHLTAHDQETLRQIAVDGLNDLAEEVEAGLIGADADEMRTDENEGISRPRKRARKGRSSS